MLDCVFLLLLFFIVASSFSEGSNVFEVKLPRAESAVTREVGDALQLGIDRTGRFTLAGEAVADEQLYEKLRQQAQASGRRTLVIAGDKNCPYEKVVLAMDIAQALQLPEISMAVESASGN